jgi:serine/threonine protein kinase
LYEIMEIGQLIGSYQIKALIGEGGMGSVFLAEHVLIGRKAAIKVLKKEFASDSTLVTRFLNEARATNAIGHPGIVEVLDFGTMPGDVPYLVMEHLRGQSLAQRIAQGHRLQVPEALAIVGQTAAALGAAHDKGIVHCDLKPDNLFLTPDSATPLGERVKVLDFGIAKLRKELTPESVKTLTWTLMGTPAYMSPEQCRGVRDEVDARTDIYALGVILYQMLCGRPPFVGEGFGDTLMMHMSQTVPAPTLLEPSIPAAIEQAILRALAKTREQRYSSMTELRRALGDGSGAPAGAAASGFGTPPPPVESSGPRTVVIPDRYSPAPQTTQLLPPPVSVATRVHTRRPPAPTWPWLVGGGGAALLALALVVTRARPAAVPPVVQDPPAAPAIDTPAAPAIDAQAAAAVVTPPPAAPTPANPAPAQPARPHPRKPAHPRRERHQPPFEVKQW